MYYFTLMAMYALSRPDPNGFLYRTDEMPLGKSYEDWTKKWWQWILDTPLEQNPANDLDGAFAHVGNTNKDVFFLAGALNRRAQRVVKTISKGQAILFPIVAFEFSLLEVPGSQTNDLVRYSQYSSDSMLHMEVILDKGTRGERVLQTGELVKYRIKSQNPFDLKFVQDNIFIPQGGQTKATADGYWCFLKENIFKPGSHTLWFQGTEQLYQTEVNYYLEIE
jgi:hypothetical protein